MCQYVIGIGDRHLSNFMVDLESGGIIGIDFGHNFGTATQVWPLIFGYCGCGLSCDWAYQAHREMRTLCIS